MKAFSFACFSAGLLLAFVPVCQAEWPQYRGPSQNGSVAGATLSPQAAAAPKVLWKASVGKGTSAITVMEGRAYTMGNTNGTDNVYCFDVKSGKEVWHQGTSVSLDPKLFEGGPRSTPTLDGSHVYALSHQGDLRCLDAATGRKLWEHSYVREFNGVRPDWGYSGSPLISGTLVVCDVGSSSGSTVALDKVTGKLVWKSGSDRPGYATPVTTEVGGQSIVLVFKADALVGYELKGGKELWRSGWKTDYDINAATPLLVTADKAFITSGYNAGCALVQFTATGAKELWRNKNLRAHINSPVATGGYIFGMDGNTGGGNLACLEVASGAKKWQEKTVKGGSLILADGKLVIATEKGELVICEASANGFKPLSRSQVLQHRCWTQPTLDAGRLFMRNNEGDLVCLDVSGK